MLSPLFMSSWGEVREMVYCEKSLLILIVTN